MTAHKSELDALTQDGISDRVVAASTETVCIALIDPRPLIRTALAHSLRSAGTRVVMFDNATEFMQPASCPPDLALVIISAGARQLGADVCQVVRALVEARPDIRIIVIADADDAPVMEATIRSGARAYIPTSLD